MLIYCLPWLSKYCLGIVTAHEEWGEELRVAKDGGITWLGPEEGSFCLRTVTVGDTRRQEGWQSVPTLTRGSRVLIGQHHVSWFKYANKIITSSSSVSLSIISDRPFVHFLVSVALMIKSISRVFYCVSRLWYLYQVSGAREEEVTLSPYHLIISRSLESQCPLLSLAVYSVSTAGAKFRSLELHKLSKVTNSNHNYIPSVCHHPTKPRITSSKCRRVGNLNKVSWGGVCFCST